MIHNLRLMKYLEINVHVCILRNLYIILSYSISDDSVILLFSSGTSESGAGLGSPSLRPREGRMTNGGSGVYTDGTRTPPMGGTPGHQRNNASGRASRQRTHKREEDDKVKRSRAWANAYELSQDLHDKQLEMLERKYGGHLRARRAARVIQQAYRHYRLNKNFDRLRFELEEKRLRRMSEFVRSKTIWTDMVASIEEQSNMHSQFFTSNDLMSNYKGQQVSYSDHFQKKTLNTSSVYSSGRTVRVIHKSHSVNVITKDVPTLLKDRRPIQRTSGLDLDTILENSRISHIPPVVPVGVAVQAAPNSITDSETNNNRNSYPELNDSSGSVSPQEAPLEPTIDLPSINFEKLLESKETDILNDSFHSDSSQDTCQSPHTTQPRYNMVQETVDNMDELDIQNDTLKADQTFVNNSEVCERTNVPQVHVEKPPPEVTAEPSEPTPGDYGSLSADDVALYMRIYGNTEVKLRKRKDGTDKSSPEASPIWKRKSAQLGGEPSPLTDEAKRMSNISETSEAESLKRISNISEISEPESYDGRGGLSSSPSSSTCSMGSDGSHTYHRSLPSANSMGDCMSHGPPQRLTDKQRKRMYRIGLNLFNK